MSADWFDELSRAFATGKSRRTALKALGASALAAATGLLLGGREAEGAQLHLCCVYECQGEPTLVHKCTTKNECPPAPAGCGPRPLCIQRVSKCSACGSVFCPDFNNTQPPE